MKVCVLVIFIMLPWISRVGDWALGWTEGNEQLQIVFVMLLFPTIMNALQYYIIDSFIKMKETGGGHGGGGDHGENEGSRGYDRLAGGEEDDDNPVDSDEDLEETEAKRAARRQAKGSASASNQEYDPARDADSPTVVGSSSSRKATSGVLPKELFPHE